MINPALYSSERGDWETPREIFDLLNSRFQFTLDAAASRSNRKCENFISIDEDALSVPWFGRVWLNPPYGRGIGRWIQKAYEESQSNADLVVCLVPARTCTAWFHDWAVRGRITFLRGRIKFVGAQSAAPFPSMLIEFYRGASPNQSGLSLL